MTTLKSSSNSERPSGVTSGFSISNSIWDADCSLSGGIAQFQLETKDITMRLMGINHINLLYYYPKPRSDVFCFKLNINISKLGY